MHTLATYSIKELNELHQQIDGKLRSTVQDAIRAGEILTNVKEKLAHGEFLPWIEKNCIFKRKTAVNYMRVYEHKSKCVTVGHLPEAYQLVAKLESAKKQTENQKAFKRVQEYKKSGVKPEGWRKNTDDKLYQEEQDRDERIKRFKEKADAESRKNAEQKTAHKKLGDKIDDAGDKISAGLKDLQDRLKVRETFKERIRISSQGKDSPFVDALIDYLQGLDDDNRRLEACHNIIKVAKSIAKELDRKVYLEA